MDFNNFNLSNKQIHMAVVGLKKEQTGCSNYFFQFLAFLQNLYIRHVNLIILSNLYYSYLQA